MKNGAEYSMRNVISDTGSTGADAYASLIRIALNEKPRTPSTASSGPSQRAQSHRTLPLQAVNNTSNPNAIRYHANGTKSCRLT